MVLVVPMVTKGSHLALHRGVSTGMVCPPISFSEAHRLRFWSVDNEIFLAAKRLPHRGLLGREACAGCGPCAGSPRASWRTLRGLGNILLPME